MMSKAQYAVIRYDQEVKLSNTQPFGAALAEFEADGDDDGLCAWRGSDGTLYSLTESRSMIQGVLPGKVGIYLLVEIDYVQPSDPGLPSDETEKFWRRHKILATGTKAEVRAASPENKLPEMKLSDSWDKGSPRYSPGGWRGRGGRPKRTDGTVIWNLPVQSTPEDKEALYQLLRDCGAGSLRERYDLIVSLLTEYHDSMAD